MIISVSRRTDIPAYYSDWFWRRLKEQFVLVRNPMNFHQVSKISLRPEDVDCIVFWTKNPEPMMRSGSGSASVFASACTTTSSSSDLGAGADLRNDGAEDWKERLRDYSYYVQFTLNAYGSEIEEQLPPLEDRIDTFRRLAEEIGPERVIWRYDPVLLSEQYTEEEHCRQFQELAARLSGCTERCMISFLDVYRKISRRVSELKIRTPHEDEKQRLASCFAEIGAQHGISVHSCATGSDLSCFGVLPGSCIDGRLIEKLKGCSLRQLKDKSQRSECTCISSVDIGQYNTCLNGCQYCYANHSKATVANNSACFDVDSPLLCGSLRESDAVKERKMVSLKQEQIEMF